MLKTQLEFCFNIFNFFIITIIKGKFMRAPTPVNWALVDFEIERLFSNFLQRCGEIVTRYNLRRPTVFISYAWELRDEEAIALCNQLLRLRGDLGRITGNDN